MVIAKIRDLDDRLQEYLGERDTNTIVDTDLVLEMIEEDDPSLYDQIKHLKYPEKNPEKYIISRWELLDV